MKNQLLILAIFLIMKLCIPIKIAQEIENQKLQLQENLK